jgi:hypothetical protein
MSSLSEESPQATGSDLLDPAAQSARRLLDEGHVRAAREVIQDALDAEDRHAELLWVLADVEFADGDLIAGRDHLAEAFEASGRQPADVARWIRALRRNRLWREALLTIETLPVPASDDPLVRAEVGAFYQACGCHAHAAERYGPGQGLTSSARAMRRWCWLWSGGPSKALHARLRNWEGARLLPTLRRRPSYLKQLDKARLEDSQVRRLQIQLETLNYRLERLWYEFDAVFTAGYRLLPLVILPVWVVLLLVIYQAGFATGMGTAAGAAAVSACIATVLVTLLVLMLLKPNAELRFRMRISVRSVAIYLFVVAVFEAAAGEGYDRRVLPASGWPSWVVLGLIVSPAAVACLPIAAVIFSGFWQFRYLRLVGEDCILYVLGLLLEVLGNLRSRDSNKSFDYRLDQARGLELAARRLVHNLVPSSAAEFLDSGDWLKQRITGWAQALRYTQRQLIAAIPGDKAKVESFLVHEIQC